MNFGHWSRKKHIWKVPTIGWQASSGILEEKLLSKDLLQVKVLSCCMFRYTDQDLMNGNKHGSKGHKIYKTVSDFRNVYVTHLKFLKAISVHLAIHLTCQEDISQYSALHTYNPLIRYCCWWCCYHCCLGIREGEGKGKISLVTIIFFCCCNLFFWQAICWLRRYELFRKIKANNLLYFVYLQLWES